MHAFVVAGGDSSTRGSAVSEILKSQNVAIHNRVVLARGGDESSIGIGAVRGWLRDIALAPVGEGSLAGIITDADLLTLEAQQALLKTIEEPPARCIIILSAATPFALLPTILSRCVLVTKPAPNAKNKGGTREELAKVRVSGIGRMLLTSDTIAAGRENAQEFIQDVIEDAHAGLASGDLTTQTILEAALAARGRLAANVNPKMVLDAFFLSFHTGQSSSS
jgi:DNA polymerase III delta prime subunit